MITSPIQGIAPLLHTKHIVEPILELSSSLTMSVESSIETASTDNIDNDVMNDEQNKELLNICQAKHERNVSVVSTKRFVS